MNSLLFKQQQQSRNLIHPMSLSLHWSVNSKTSLETEHFDERNSSNVTLNHYCYNFQFSGFYCWFCFVLFFFFFWGEGVVCFWFCFLTMNMLNTSVNTIYYLCSYRAWEPWSRLRTHQLILYSDVKINGLDWSCSAISNVMALFCQTFPFLRGLNPQQVILDICSKVVMTWNSTLFRLPLFYDMVQKTM